MDLRSAFEDSSCMEQRVNRLGRFALFCANNVNPWFGADEPGDRSVDATLAAVANYLDYGPGPDGQWRSQLRMALGTIPTPRNCSTDAASYAAGAAEEAALTVLASDVDAAINHATRAAECAASAVYAGVYAGKFRALGDAGAEEAAEAARTELNHHLARWLADPRR